MCLPTFSLFSVLFRSLIGESYKGTRKKVRATFVTRCPSSSSAWLNQQSINLFVGFLYHHSFIIIQLLDVRIESCQS